MNYPNSLIGAFMAATASLVIPTPQTQDQCYHNHQGFPNFNIRFCIDFRLIHQRTGSIAIATANSRREEKPRRIKKRGLQTNNGFYRICTDPGVFGREGRWNEVLDISHIINQLGDPVDSDTYAYLLQACGNMKSLIEGKQVHARMLINGIHQNVFLVAKLVSMYVKCGSLVDARLIFDKMRKRNVFSWNTMIAAYARYGCYEEALALYYQMQQARVDPDNFTLPSALKACAGLAALEQGKEIHHYITKSGFESDVFVGNALVDMYAKCGSIRDARQVFDRMSQRDLVSWNAMIAGYAQNGHGDEALKLLGHVQLAGVKPDSITIASVLPACSQLATLQQGKQIHDYVLRTGLESDMAVGNALVAMYVGCGSLDDARQVFDKLSQKNVVSWTAMIAGYVEDRQVDMALKLFRRMLLTGLKPDSITISSVLPACACLAALQQGKEIHACIIRCGLESNPFVQSALIDMYAKCGNIEGARQVFDKITQGDVVSWNAMIVGYGMHGQADYAIALFFQMQEAGIKPDHITFTAVLFACSHTGLVDEGWQFFECMLQDYQIRPTPEHYACMVDLLGRAGRLDEAQDFIKSMPLNPNARVWGALLGACRVHYETELGEHVAKRLFELEPENAGNYVLLSNIYAAARRWDDAAKARTMMKDRGLKKMPGCSWIEIEKRVHAFFS